MYICTNNESLSKEINLIQFYYHKKLLYTSLLPKTGQQYDTLCQTQIKTVYSKLLVFSFKEIG